MSDHLVDRTESTMKDLIMGTWIRVPCHLLGVVPHENQLAFTFVR